MVDLPRAARALSALIKNPDDLPQVFNLIDSMSTVGHFRRSRSRFAKTDTGQRLLATKPDIVAILADRERLRAMPEGSLGRAYLAFVESEKISAEGIRKASETARSLAAIDRELAFIRERMRDTHDLWHAATGYRGDLLGEIGLLAFTVAQQWNTGIAVMVLTAMLKAKRRIDVVGVVRDGYRRGRKAAWLPSQDWESLLEKPLDDVRARLKLGAPPIYTPIRMGDLRAQGFFG
jgi:ubiquinone biosynthesis protein COQ4